MSIHTATSPSLTIITSMRKVNTRTSTTPIRTDMSTTTTTVARCTGIITIITTTRMAALIARFAS